MMTEDRFWSLIDLAGASPEDHHLHRIWLRLRDSEPEEIIGFIDRLTEVLFRLDHRDIAKQPWRDVSEPWWLPRIPGISADGFLYARCDAVLHGRDLVEAIIRDPRLFKRRWDVQAEGLLEIGPNAWTAVTKRDFYYDRDTPLSYETGSNPDGNWAR